MQHFVIFFLNQLNLSKNKHYQNDNYAMFIINN